MCSVGRIILTYYKLFCLILPYFFWKNSSNLEWLSQYFKFSFDITIHHARLKQLKIKFTQCYSLNFFWKKHVLKIMKLITLTSFTILSNKKPKLTNVKSQCWVTDTWGYRYPRLSTRDSTLGMGNLTTSNLVSALSMDVST